MLDTDEEADEMLREESELDYFSAPAEMAAFDGAATGESLSPLQDEGYGTEDRPTAPPPPAAPAKGAPLESEARRERRAAPPAPQSQLSLGAGGAIGEPASAEATKATSGRPLASMPEKLDVKTRAPASKAKRALLLFLLVLAAVLFGWFLARSLEYKERIDAPEATSVPKAMEAPSPGETPTGTEVE